MNFLDKAKPKSIDAFLNIHKEFKEFGKQLISEIIYHTEFEGNLGIKENCFLQYLFHSLSLDRYSNYNVISFNYDRLFEAYFLQGLQNFYKLSKEDAITQLKKLNIHHVYGRLSNMPAENAGTNRNLINYGYLQKTIPLRNKSINDITFDDQHRDIFQAVWNDGINNLKLFDETTENKELLGETLRKSDQIVFLGCSYHKQNLDALWFDFSKSYDDKLIIGTGYGLGKMEREKVKFLNPAFSEIYPVTAYHLLTDHFSMDCPELNFRIHKKTSNRVAI